jgi:uracil-DNA glycosylase family 4
VDWREEVAQVRRRSFATEQYWGRPIPGWGDDKPEIVIVGLAPAAHGGNRTGRVFTGDRSGDFLFASLYRCGLADSPVSVTAGDGQRLRHTRMVAAVRCAPPANKPTPGERDTCAPWLAEELRRITPSARVLICLGGFAWQALWPVLRATGFVLPSRRPPFGHGAEAELGPPPVPAVPAVRAGRVPRTGRAAGPAARLLSPQPAEHVHRPHHAGHAGRDLPPRPRVRRPGRPSLSAALRPGPPRPHLTHRPRAQSGWWDRTALRPSVIWATTDLYRYFTVHPCGCTSRMHCAW